MDHALTQAPLVTVGHDSAPPANVVTGDCLRLRAPSQPIAQELPQVDDRPAEEPPEIGWDSERRSAPFTHSI
jgi:hypothetical protein